jgi:hypothetical protein
MSDRQSGFGQVGKDLNFIAEVRQLVLPSDLEEEILMMPCDHPTAVEDVIPLREWRISSTTRSPGRVKSAGSILAWTLSGGTGLYKWAKLYPNVSKNRERMESKA